MCAGLRFRSNINWSYHFPPKGNLKSPVTRKIVRGNQLIEYQCFFLSPYMENFSLLSKKFRPSGEKQHQNWFFGRNKYQKYQYIDLVWKFAARAARNFPEIDICLWDFIPFWCTRILGNIMDIFFHLPKKIHVQSSLLLENSPMETNIPCPDMEKTLVRQTGTGCTQLPRGRPPPGLAVRLATSTAST